DIGRGYNRRIPSYTRSGLAGCQRECSDCHLRESDRPHKKRTQIPRKIVTRKGYDLRSQHRVRSSIKLQDSTRRSETAPDEPHPEPLGERRKTTLLRHSEGNYASAS